MPKSDKPAYNLMVFLNLLALVLHLSRTTYIILTLLNKGERLMIRKLCLTIALLGSCTYAGADVNDTGYIGLGFGSVDYDAESISNFNDPTGFELMLGKEISRNLSFELSYIDFGEADDGTAPVWRLDGKSITAGALLGGKVGKTADVFLKLGLHSWDIDLTEDGAGVIARDDGTDIFYGFGVAVKTSDNISIGARYNIYDFGGDDVTMLSINAQLSF
jgi:opacity protein-like surface antigen